MRQVLILGYEENLQGQVLKGYLTYYGGKWAQIACTDICCELAGIPQVVEILERDSIPLDISDCLTFDQARQRYWDIVITPKAADNLEGKLESLRFGVHFSLTPIDLQSALPSHNGQDSSLEHKLEMLKKEALKFIGRELLAEPEPLESA